MLNLLQQVIPIMKRLHHWLLPKRCLHMARQIGRWRSSRTHWHYIRIIRTCWMNTANFWNTSDLMWCLRNISIRELLSLVRRIHAPLTTTDGPLRLSPRWIRCTSSASTRNVTFYSECLRVIQVCAGLWKRTTSVTYTTQLLSKATRLLWLRRGHSLKRGWWLPARASLNTTKSSEWKQLCHISTRRWLNASEQSKWKIYWRYITAFLDLWIRSERECFVQLRYYYLILLCILCLIPVMLIAVTNKFCHLLIDDI